MANKERTCLHLPKRVLRHYNYIQTITRSPMTIGALEPGDVVATFQDFMAHVLDQA
ncbi:hypothetical protein MtrunA17_Chr5g0433401 [Medicago truncatula]|uniref:Uncharacterized protein n=1 Tax=Medicago truncatula TaxID=3880 RepID=A0A396HTY0_MEDTR|nr:hypothetical protein MtrunA17_Chr5g0433401 [Medicago truncatula]